MAHIVNPTVSTPEWHGTANLAAAVAAVMILTIMAVSGAVIAESAIGAAVAMVAGISTVVAAIISASRQMAMVESR